MSIKELHTTAGFKNAISGPYAVVFEFANKHCPYTFMETVYNSMVNKYGVPAYKIDPGYAGSSALINTGIYQVYHHGKVVQQCQVIDLENVQDLEDLVYYAKSLNE